MNDLYEAMGTIAAAAHATGDTIDENIRPEDNQNIQHGFDIFHKSNYIRIGQHRDEQRFEVTSPYTFLNALERNYSDAELNAQADVDLNSLPPEERQQVISSVLEEDLRRASGQYEEFTRTFSDQIGPADIDLIKLTYGDTNLWNGFLVRDHIYPTEESFSIADYQDAVATVRAIRLETTEVVQEVVDVLSAAADSEELTPEPETASKTERHPSSPGFQ